MFKYAAGESIRKVIDRYGSGVDFIYPDIADDVIKATEHLSRYAWFAGAGLTGSTIVKGTKPKDIDLVLLTRDYSAFLNDREGLELPVEIGGLPVDRGIRAKALPYRGAFSLLTLSDRTLYVSALYDIRSAEGLTVVSTGAERWAKASQAVDAKRFAQPRPAAPVQPRRVVPASAMPTTRATPRSVASGPPADRDCGCSRKRDISSRA